MTQTIVRPSPASAADGPLDQTLGSKWLVDFEASHAFNDHVRLTLGAENMLDTYPDKDKLQANRNNGILYPGFSPFGFNGGFWYARAVVTF